MGEIRAIRQLFKHRNKRAAAKELFSHELIRKQFISDVTGIPLEEIKSARIGNPYLWRRHRRQKQGIVDILVELNGNTKVNIEIQVKFYSYWDRRNLFYLAKMYTEDLRVGENYEKLKKSMTISLLDFNLASDPEYHSVYYLRDENGRCFTDLFEIHIIELRKTLSGQDALDDWIRFFNADSEEALDMIHTTNAGINMAIGEVKKMSMSARMWACYEAHMKEVRDRNAREHYVKQQGIEQGIGVGRAQMLEEMLRKQMSPEDIADLCSCDLAEVKAVQEKMYKKKEIDSL